MQYTARLIYDGDLVGETYLDRREDMNSIELLIQEFCRDAGRAGSVRCYRDGDGITIEARPEVDLTADPGIREGWDVRFRNAETGEVSRAVHFDRPPPVTIAFNALAGALALERVAPRVWVATLPATQFRGVEVAA